MRNILVILCILFAGASSATAYTIGSTSQYPGFSAKDILNSGGSLGNGVYWIDPDLGSTSNAMQAYCDMTTQGGGWTLLRARDAGLPDVLLTAANNLIAPSSGSVSNQGSLHVIGTTFDVFITGYLNGLIGGTYVFVSGTYDNFRTELIEPYHVPNPFGFPQLYNAVVNSGDRFDLYLREAVTQRAAAPAVPIPSALWLLGSGLLGLAGWRRFRKG